MHLYFLPYTVRDLNAYAHTHAHMYTYARTRTNVHVYAAGSLIIRHGRADH